MAIIYIVAALILIFSAVVYLLHSTRKGTDVVQGKVDKWEGLLVIVIGAVIIILGVLFYQEVIAVADPVTGAEPPVLLPWLRSLLKAIADGTGLPRLR